MTSEYQPLGGDKESGGTPSEAPSTLQQITGKLTKAWASANDEKRSWGEFFAFSKMGVPTLAEVETWGWDNLKAFKGNFLLIFYVVWLIFNVINPVGLLFMVLFLFLSVYLVSSPSKCCTLIASPADLVEGPAMHDSRDLKLHYVSFGSTRSQRPGGVRKQGLDGVLRPVLFFESHYCCSVHQPFSVLKVIFLQASL
mmetsp:Transcript_863/g.2161  ORF Transcript_863/g.2161 Transcript_863/m.2161 type:complete len:197 (+) Transcript_863:146-736(+)